MTTFVVTGQKQLEARLRAIGQAPHDILREVAVRGVAEAKAIVPRQTGNLGRTIRIGTVSSTEASIIAGGQMNVGYAGAVEFGSRPHTIVPRRAKVLAWGGPRTRAGRLRTGGKATNFARRVNHPGNRAQPYLVPGFEKALSMVGLGSVIKRWNQAA